MCLSALVLSQSLYINSPRHECEVSLPSISCVLGEILYSSLILISSPSISRILAVRQLFHSPTLLPVVAFLRSMSFSHWVLALTEVLTHPHESFLLLSFSALSLYLYCAFLLLLHLFLFYHSPVFVSYSYLYLYNGGRRAQFHFRGCRWL